MATTPIDRFVRNSETSVWRDCRLKWFLTFYLGFLSDRINPNFWLGGLVHYALSWYHLGKTPDPAHLFLQIAEQSLEQERDEAITIEGFDLDYDNVEELEKIKWLGVAMLEGYVEWDKANRDFEAIDSEIAYYIELETIEGHPFTFVMRLDLLAENSDGIRALDFKTAADFRAVKTVDQDMQFRRYPWALRVAHPDWADEVLGSRWIGLRKIIPSGRSKPPYFDIVDIDLTPAEFEQVGRELVAEVSEILRVEDKLNEGQDPRDLIWPSPTFDCSWKCDYFRNGLCRGWRGGLDVTKFGENYGTWGNDMYEEYREDFEGAVPIGRREGGE